MYTLKFFSITFALLLLFLLGAILRSADILALCLPMLFYFFFAMQGEEPETTIERDPLPKRGMAESTLTVTFNVHVKNPMPFTEILDRVKGLTGKNYFLFPARPEMQGIYDLKLRRGVIEIGPLVVRHHNFLFTQYFEHTSGTSDTVVVIPKVHDLKPLKLSPRQTRVFYGLIPARRAGIGEEFFSLRTYSPGDEHRKINWKASSRTGQLFTNEYEAMKTTDVIVILDARRENALGKDKLLLEYSLDAAASVSAAALKGGNRLGFLSYGDCFHRLYPGTTRRHLLKILEVLTEIQPQGAFRLDYVRNFVSAFFSTGSQLVLISPLLDSSFLEGVKGLYTLGFDLLIISPSPLSLQWAYCRRDMYHTLAKKLLEEERGRLVSQLREYATVVDWNVEQRLGKALAEVRLFHRRR